MNTKKMPNDRCVLCTDAWGSSHQTRQWPRVSLDDPDAKARQPIFFLGGAQELTRGG